MTSVLRMPACEWITCLFITLYEPETDHSPERFVCCNLRIRCRGNMCQLRSNQAVVLETCLPSRCLGIDYSGFQAFWHTRCHANVRQLRSNRALASRCPVIDVHSGFSRHAIILNLGASSTCAAFVVWHVTVLPIKEMSSCMVFVIRILSISKLLTTKGHREHPSRILSTRGSRGLIPMTLVNMWLG
jgi:hypothetical protein